MVNVNMAMEAPDARICGSSLNDGEGVRVNCDCIAIDRVLVELGFVIRFVPLSAVQYSHLQTMEVHWVLKGNMYDSVRS